MKVLCVLGKYQYGDVSRGIGIESSDRSGYHDLADMNQQLLRTVEAERPDVMLVVQTNYEIWVETLHAVKSRGITATLCWTTDDSWKYRQVSRFLGPAFHAVTTTYPDKVAAYHRDGISQVLVTKWAAGSSHLRRPFSAAACCYKVSFVGAAHGNRKRRIARLRAEGIEVDCFGHGWPNGPIAAEQIPEIMQQSIISLNFANSYGENQVKARTFEVPGAGGFLLTERAPFLEQCYAPGREIVVFDDDRELLDKIPYYLAHPAERDAIARAGHERTCREHTYERRLQEALEFAVRARESANSAGTRGPAVSFSRALEKHALNWPLKVLRALVVTACSAIWGNRRGPRAARRLCFEVGWRFFGARTFSAAGWVGRMFPNR
jgi:spore maturation protein CgeB